KKHEGADRTSVHAFVLRLVAQACGLRLEAVCRSDHNPTTTPPRRMRGLRFCAIVLNAVDAMLLLRIRTVFALVTLNTSPISRRFTVWSLKVRETRRSVSHTSS